MTNPQYPQHPAGGQPTQPVSGQPYPPAPYSPAPYGQPQYAPNYGQQPPYGPPQPVYMQVPPEPRNGLGMTALICGIVGLLFGLTPLTGAFIGGPLSVLAVIFGAVGFSRARKGRATNRKTALWGLILGCLAFVLACVDAGLFFAALNHVSDCLDATSNAINNIDNQGAQDAANAACQN